VEGGEEIFWQSYGLFTLDSFAKLGGQCTGQIKQNVLYVL